MKVKGRRVHPNKHGSLSMQPGDYGKDGRGVWHVRPPDSEVHVGSIEKHTVVEHEDGTITVSPSILLDQGAGLKGFHGYLRKGVWES